MGISLAPEYARLLPEYQEKWLQIALSTEPIDSTQATEAVKRAYRVNGFKEPQVYLCGSPFAGLQKVVELANELGDLGKGLNQKIQLHNEWFFTHQALLSQHIGQVARPLAYLRYLFRPTFRESFRRKSLISSKVRAASLSIPTARR